MKIIKPSVAFDGAVPTDYEGALKFIAKCGHLCYKSESLVVEGFVRGLITVEHLAMVEHSNFVVRTRRMDYQIGSLQGKIGKYLTAINTPDYTYVGGSLTAWFKRGVELGWNSIVLSPFISLFNSLFAIGNEFIDTSNQWEVCPHDEIPKELHRYSAKFICDRGVSHELVRHRPCSFAQESTRYVNYGGKDMEFIEPAGWAEWEGTERITFKAACEYSEYAYKQMLNQGRKPQQARAVLPNALKTEIVVTADAAEWHISENCGRIHLPILIWSG